MRVLGSSYCGPPHKANIRCSEPKRVETITASQHRNHQHHDSARQRDAPDDTLVLHNCSRHGKGKEIARTNAQEQWQRRQTGPQPTKSTLGSSAGDAPEKRKNSELYEGLKHVPSARSGHAAPAQTSDTAKQPYASSSSHQPPPLPSTDSPAVSYMLSPHPSHTATAAAPSKAHGTAPFHFSASTSSNLHTANLDQAHQHREGHFPHHHQQQQGSQQQPQQRHEGQAIPSTSAAAAHRQHLACKPEVLSPVGGWPQLRAAVENGADAVYFGLEDFNARARAANFTLEELPDVMSYLHARGVKGFVALNVLVFGEELPAVEARVRAMARAGVDAVIVQDWGVVQLLRRTAPGLPVHGSTQMSVTSAEGADWVAGLGVERVVVGRELSVREIAKVRDGLPAATEIEAFVHGALCVSYSGQCFSSEAWGGRSANRGQCAQACRMPYGLLVDGLLRELGEVKYLLSPQDLMAVEQVPDLIRAGVSCFKIEGRLKGPEYVALTTQVYRRAVDAAWVALTAESGSQDSESSSGGEGRGRMAPAATTLSDQARWDLEQVFARGQDGLHRGLTPGFLEGVRHQRLVRGRSPRHRGVFLGRVEAVTARGVVLELQAPLKRGDGVAFDAGRPEEEEPGGAVYDILPQEHSGGGGDGRGKAAALSGNRVTVVLGQGPGQSYEFLHRISPGDLVWRTKDPSLESRLRASYDNLAASETRRVPVSVAVSGRLGSALKLTLQDSDGRTVVSESRVPLEAARGRPMVAEDVARALGPQLGEATLAMEGEVDVAELDLAAGLFLPASELKSLRRQAVEALLSARSQHPRAAGLAEAPVLPGLLTEAAALPPPPQALRLLAEMSCTRLGGGSAAATATAGSGDDGEAIDGEGNAMRVASGAAAGPSGAGGRRGGRGAAASATDVCVRVLCRSREQVDAALRVPWLREVVVDFLEVMGLKEAVAAVRASGRRVVVATPRVLKPDEQRLWLFYLRLGADALLVRSAGMLHTLQRLGGPGATVPDVPYPIPALEGDFSLNAANVLSASLLLSGGCDGAQNDSTHTDSTAPSATAAPVSDNNSIGSSSSSSSSNNSSIGGSSSSNSSNSSGCSSSTRSGGLLRLAPTHDLHAGQLSQLAAGLGARAAQLEAVVHQHLPIFHTEHCVFCRFLSSGNNYQDCGHPCERHRLHLRDQQGADHLVLADMGCRNTVFNAQAQSGVFYLRDLIRAGFRTVRVELVDEDPQYVAPLLEGYRDVILGRRGPGDLWRWLGTLPDANGAIHGVEAGSLQVHKERSRDDMKPTAAALKQQHQQQQAGLANAGRRQ